MGLRLNLGAGNTPLEGYDNLDRKTGQEVYPLALPDACADEVRASHVLEHFPYSQTLDVLREWVRVLRPGGRLRVAVPDFDWIVDQYRAGQPINTMGYMFGGQVDGNDFHKAGFSESYLRELLKAVGIEDVRKWTSPYQDCAALPVSLNLEGFKAAPVEIKRGDVAAVMSCPRLGFTENWFGITTIRGMGIPFERVGGAFWGQALTLGLKNALEKLSPRYILTIDYDSLFTPRDVQDLYRLMESNPEVDALAALQLGRERTAPLLTVKGDDGKNVGKVKAGVVFDDLMQVGTSHFGLTMIRADKIKALPKPWFKHEPNPTTGEWDDERIDDDIWFWRRWAEAGNTVYSANRVVIGHMQNVATWPDRNLRPVFQYLSEYAKSGKPASVLR